MYYYKSQGQPYSFENYTIESVFHTFSYKMGTLAVPSAYGCTRNEMVQLCSIVVRYANNETNFPLLQSPPHTHGFVGCCVAVVHTNLCHYTADLFLFANLVSEEQEIGCSWEISFLSDALLQSNHSDINLLTAWTTFCIVCQHLLTLLVQKNQYSIFATFDAINNYATIMQLQQNCYFSCCTPRGTTTMTERGVADINTNTNQPGSVNILLLVVCPTMPVNYTYIFFLHFNPKVGLQCAAQFFSLLLLSQWIGRCMCLPINLQYTTVHSL